MKHEDRAYQTEIVEAVFNYLFTKTGNPVVAAPGGVGKSHSMNRIIKRLVVDYPGTRVLSLVHDAKIIDQNCNSMLKFWPDAPCGIYSAGLKQRDTHFPIIYAGIQSVHKRPESFGKIHIVIVDECDLVSPKEETMYQKFIAALRVRNPNLRVIGFTATPYRLGTGCLTNSDMWDEICIDLTKTERFNWFIEQGYLSPLVTKKAVKEIDITDIRMKGGEFDEHDLQEAADTDELNAAVVEECIRYGSDRKHWLVFSSGVKHGHRLAKLFNARGVPARMLSGEDSMAYREEVEDLFKSGRIRCLVNCGLYGRGWDFPALDMLAWARATQSTGLWIQGCVRGTRRAPGKQNCIAAGQRVLTERGLIPIELITREIKVWDGVDFVSHGGIVCRGQQQTITYAGLTATPDHRVKTKEGWKTFGESFLEQAEICVTGSDETPVREIEGHFRGGDPTSRSILTSPRFDSMCSVWKNLTEGHDQCSKRTGWMSKVWKKTVQTKALRVLALFTMSCSKESMSGSNQHEIPSIRRKRDSVQIQLCGRDGAMDRIKSWFAQRLANRQNQQRRKLRARKLTIFDSFAKCLSYYSATKQHKSKSVSGKIPGDKVCGFNTAKTVFVGAHSRTDSREVLSAVVQTKREVWDILNCGPRHSFTCEGLLVHNCIVLDFAGNTRRLGPINDPIVPVPRRKGDKEKGEVPVKECPECHSYVHTRVMECPDCGYIFPPPQTVKKTASTDDILRGGTADVPQIEDFFVLSVHYSVHLSKAGNKTMRVVYSIGTYNFSEYLIFGSENRLVQRKLKVWWEHRGGEHPLPVTAEEAVSRAREELRVPSTIRVIVNQKYPEVVGAEFDEPSHMKSNEEDTDNPF